MSILVIWSGPQTMVVDIRQAEGVRVRGSQKNLALIDEYCCSSWMAEGELPRIPAGRAPFYLF